MFESHLSDSDWSANCGMRYNESEREEVPTSRFSKAMTVRSRSGHDVALDILEYFNKLEQL